MDNFHGSFPWFISYVRPVIGMTFMKHGELRMELPGPPNHCLEVGGQIASIFLF